MSDLAEAYAHAVSGMSALLTVTVALEVLGRLEEPVLLDLEGTRVMCPEDALDALEDIKRYLEDRGLAAFYELTKGDERWSR